MEPFEHRIPLRQLILEMASYLKKELSAKMGNSLYYYFEKLKIILFIYFKRN